MTASTVKFTQVSEAEALPVGVRDSRRPVIEEVSGTVATTSIDEIGDKILALRADAAVVPHRLILKNEDLDADATPLLAVNVGLHRADTGAVVDADCIASAITTLQAANNAGVDILRESVGLGDVGKTLWEIAGLSAHPGCDLIITFTVSAAAATAASGKVSLLLIGSVA